MRRLAPVEVFIEMGLYRDWSRLRFSSHKDSHSESVSSLQGPFVLGTMYSVSRWTCDSAKTCNYRNLSGRSVCVSVCVRLRKRDRVRVISSKSSTAVLTQNFFCSSG